MNRDYQNVQERVHDARVEALIVNRWSPRVYLPDPVNERDLALVFEAARLAPSCYNEQPWRFVTSTETSYARFLDLLVEGNQAWAKTAPVLGFIAASRRYQRNGKDNYHAAFDSGAAWMAMSLQARALSLYTHGMGGIHYDRVYEALALDRDEYQVICGFTIGRLDPAGDEPLTERKPASEIWRQVV